MTDTVMARFSLVLKKEDMARIHVKNEAEIFVDLHGLRTDEAIKFLNNIINLNKEECIIRVIHGFNHGTALRDMINNRFCNPRIRNRQVVKSNPGMTILRCASACR